MRRVNLSVMLGVCLVMALGIVSYAGATQPAARLDFTVNNWSKLVHGELSRAGFTVKFRGRPDPASAAYRQLVRSDDLTVRRSYVVAPWRNERKYVVKFSTYRSDQEKRLKRVLDIIDPDGAVNLSAVISP